MPSDQSYPFFLDYIITFSSLLKGTYFSILSILSFFLRVFSHFQRFLYLPTLITAWTCVLMRFRETEGLVMKRRLCRAVIKSGIAMRSRSIVLGGVYNVSENPKDNFRAKALKHVSPFNSWIQFLPLVHNKQVNWAKVSQCKRMFLHLNFHY